MDPSASLRDPSFRSSNESSMFYNWPDTWPFQTIDGVYGHITPAAFKQERLEQNPCLPEMMSNNQVLSIADSTISEHQMSNETTRKEALSTSDEDSSKRASTNDGTDMMELTCKRLKVIGSIDKIDDSRAEVNSRDSKQKFQQSPLSLEAPKQGFIHVRARRGQATDSHSLAERARREKISERMKILQNLVPGCNKVIGKALVLDEIISYIRSLQHQVEFLSMKLEAVNSRMYSGMEVYSPKDTIGTPDTVFGSNANRLYEQRPVTELLHLQVGGGFDR